MRADLRPQHGHMGFTKVPVNPGYLNIFYAM